LTLIADRSLTTDNKSACTFQFSKSVPQSPFRREPRGRSRGTRCSLKSSI